MTPTTPTRASPHQRKPNDSQRALGGDMSMMFFVRCQAPRRFTSPDDHLIRGLNMETIVGLHFPTPDWMNAIEYSILQPDPDCDSSNAGIFSLNLSIYNRSVDPTDWDDMWFFMHGPVHPYTLTWEVEAGDGLQLNAAQEYTIPALIVRDNSYQPVASRKFDTATDFPIMPPLVSFSGPIIGPGSTLLKDDPISGLRDIQRKCCGFVQLSTFISPGNPTRTPFKGFHPFQVFVIFPIHANPWTLLCKKMVDKPDTSFQPSTMFSCTGKVAGFLNHGKMVHPPSFPQDHVFIVVPDSWTFHDRPARSSVATSLATPPSTAKSASNLLDRSKFLSPSKRVASTTAFSIGQLSGSENSTAISSPQASETSSTGHQSDSSTPSRKPRLTYTMSHGAQSVQSPAPLVPVTLSHNSLGQPESMSTPHPSITVKAPSAPQLVEYSVPLQAVSPNPDDINRPIRSRNPPKKFSISD